jgi:class 3 adenylate cyclase
MPHDTFRNSSSVFVFNLVMRKGLRFQTKLMLTLIAAISVVTLSLIAVTENKVSQAYTKQFSRDFNHLISQLQHSREERSQEYFQLCEELAAQPFVIASLSGKATKEQNLAFWRFYMDSLYRLDDGNSKRPEGQGPQRRGGPSPEILAQMGSFAIVTKEGEIIGLNHPMADTKENERRRMAEKRLRSGAVNMAKAKQRIDSLFESHTQQTLYLPFDSKENGGYIQEVVSTPVKKPGSEEVIGLFLRATTAETEAERFLERYQQEFDASAPLISGIFVDGELYSRHIETEEAKSIAEVVAARIQQPAKEGERDRIQFKAEIGGSTFRIYIAPLNRDTPFEPAYQVSAFSLATLESDLAELRLRGSGVGGFAILFGLGIAYFFSRRLAVPIGELTKATDAIRKGDLETRIQIRSRDEIGELSTSFNEMAEGLQQRAIYREILGKVSDETVAQAMISGDLDLELGGELKTVSVLFCDIREFTSITEHMPPTGVIELLNQHMTAMTAIVRKHYGVVDKFVGDEIMAVFGALKSYGNDAENAAACALEMITERERLNRDLGTPIRIGIGIATGEVVAGCMGSVDRLNYTVLGARVNLASRLCNEAGNMEVIIDDKTGEALNPEGFGIDPIAGLQLKGFSGNQMAYRLGAGKNPSPMTEKETVASSTDP